MKPSNGFPSNLLTERRLGRRSFSQIKVDEVVRTGASSKREQANSRPAWGCPVISYGDETIKFLMIKMKQIEVRQLEIKI